MRKLFSLFAAVLFAGSMMAGEVTWDWATNSYSSASADAVVWSHDSVTLTLAKGTSSTAANNYLGGGGNSHTRVYQNNTLTFAPALGVTIESIEITATSTDYAGKFKNSTWTNATASSSSTTVTITPTDGTSDVVCTINAATRATAVKVTFIKGTAPAVVKPVISGKEKFIGETEITITCVTEGATIYYTTDGTAPSASSTTYDPVAKFKINDTKTVKAIAIKGEDKSAIEEKTFTKYDAKTCAEAAALAKDVVTGLNEFTVTYVNGGNIYVKDATGYELIYAFSFGLVAGDVVNGFIGVSAPYNGLPELKPSGVTLSDLTVVHGEAPAPEEITAAPTAADVNKYLVIKNVSVAAGEFTTASATNLDATIGEETFVLRNNFKLAQTFEAGKKYDIVGAGAIYVKDATTTLQLYFISATESTTTAIDNNAIEGKAVKTIKNGQLLIEKNGVVYNVLGEVVR